MTRAEIPRDVMTFWVRSGVLQPIEAPSGTGNRLRFHWHEVNLAAVMNQLRILGVKLEGMLSIGRVYREALAFFDDLELERGQVHALWTVFRIESGVIARRREWQKYKAVTLLPNFNPEQYPELVAAAADYSFEDEFDAEILSAAEERHGDERVTRDVLDAREKITKEDFYRHLHPYLTISEQPKAGDPSVSHGDVEDMTFFWRTGEGEDYRFAWGTASSEKIREDGATAIIAIDVTTVLYKVWNPDADRDAGE